MVWQHLQALPPVKVFAPEYHEPDPADAPRRPFTVTKLDEHTFDIEAPWLERILAGSNMDDYESLQYFQTQLGDAGVLDELVKQGVQENDTILIGEYQFDYVF